MISYLFLLPFVKGVCHIKECSCTYNQYWCNSLTSKVQDPFCNINKQNCYNCNGIWCLMPTLSPRQFPTLNPSQIPTLNPSQMPTLNPSQMPTLNPTFKPTFLIRNKIIIKKTEWHVYYYYGGGFIILFIFCVLITRKCSFHFNYDMKTNENDFKDDVYNGYTKKKEIIAVANPWYE